ncbi:MAG: VWA domain-containing protein [Bacteroidetes bacterium]|nr:VWA domain-containing protein [Bacteroidota bacterium]
MLFANKVYLFLLLIIPLIITFYIIGISIKKYRLLLFSKLYLTKNLVSRNLHERQVLKFILQLTALTFFILALAGPKFGTKMIELKRKGIEIIIAVDTSISMLAEDIKPNRMKMVKSELTRIISELKTNKIGIIAFAGQSFLQCPLTLDSNAVKLFLEYLDVNIIPEPGTNIESAIRLANQSFSKKTKANKVLILLTDGEDQNNKPLEAAKEAAKLGIKIYTIGFGLKSGELIPIRKDDGSLIDYKKDATGKTVTSRLDEGLLKKITHLTAGNYYYSRNGYLDVDKITTDINKLEKQDLSSKMKQQYEHRFYYFLALGILIILIEMFL